MQGLLGSSFDSVTVKTAKFAADKLIPAVGGGIADTMDASIASVLLVKSSVGVTGLIVMIAVCILPMMEACAVLMGIRIACTVAAPVASSNLVSAAEKFGDVIRMQIVICASALTMGIIMMGSAIKAGMSIV